MISSLDHFSLAQLQAAVDARKKAKTMPNPVIEDWKSCDLYYDKSGGDYTQVQHGIANSFKPSSSEDTMICVGCNVELFTDQLEYHKCNTLGLKKACVAMKTPDEDWTSDDEIKAATKCLEAKELSTEEGQELAQATTYGSGHRSRITNMQINLRDAIVDNAAELGKQAELVEDACGELVPKAFISLGGERTRDKCRLASLVLWKVVINLRNKKATEGECPFLQPASQDTYLRSLLASMKEQYDWRFSLTDDFKFQGGLNARIAMMYAERSEQWPNYGTASNKQIPQVFDTKDLDWTVFDEDNLEDHQLKCMGVCSTHLAFRGNKEHTHLTVANIIEGVFDPTHELKGMSWIGVDNFQDKAHKLTVHNNVKRSTNNMMRLPVEIENMSSQGGTLKRYTNKIAPGQKRFYCRAATLQERHRFTRAGFPNAEMSPKAVIGVNTVGVMMKKSMKKLGINTAGHGGRHLCISTMVNDATVNVQESLAAARHTSVAAQKNYVTRDNKSEMARFVALGSISRKEPELENDK